MATITFSGPAKTITIGYDGPFTVVAAIDLYSAWKRWIVEGNGQYLPAFSDSVGGNDLGGGSALGNYLFLRNDSGWRIAPANQAHTLTINGELYAADPATPIIAPPAADVLVTLQRSAATLVSETGVSGLTGPETAALQMLLKYAENARGLSEVTGIETLYDDDGVTPLKTRPVNEDAAGTIPYRGNGAGRVGRFE